MDQRLQSYQAVIEKVIQNGRHGPYAVATVEAFGSVTFALKHSVWIEQGTPEPGTYVILSDIQKKRAGWRAQQARFFRPSDEQQATIDTNIEQQGEKST